MKKLTALLLAVLLLGCASSALADIYVPKHINELDDLPDMPALSDFAAMRTKQEGNIVSIFLNKEVDNLRANWLEYENEHEEELEVDDELTAYLDTTGHKYQVGAHWTNAYATETDENGNPLQQPITMATGNKAPVKTTENAYQELQGYLNYNEIQFTMNGSKADKSAIEADIKAAQSAAAKDIEKAQKKGTLSDQKDDKGNAKYTTLSDYQSYYYCIKVEKPYYAVVKELGDNKFCILSRYKYTADPKYIKVPAGFKLYRVNGYATAWHPTYAASDGTSDGRYTVAYLSDQTIDGNTWTVAYGRNGKIQWFYVTLYDTEFFGYDLGTTIVKFEPCNTGWFIREITEQYEDGTYVSAYFNRTGNGKLSFYRASEFFEDESYFTANPSSKSTSSSKASSKPTNDDYYDDGPDDGPYDGPDEDGPEADVTPKKPTPDPSRSVANSYVLDTTTGVFHRDTCYLVEDASGEEWEEYSSSSLEWLYSDYTPCSECEP